MFRDRCVHLLYFIRPVVFALLVRTIYAQMAVDYAPLDIGSPAIPGSFFQVSGGYELKGNGADIGGTKDQFQFAYRQQNGDFDFQVHLADLTITDAYVKAGLMIRETLQSTSRFSAIFASSAQLGSFFESRATATSAAVVSAPAIKFPANYP